MSPHYRVTHEGVWRTAQIAAILESLALANPYLGPALTIIALALGIEEEHDSRPYPPLPRLPSRQHAP